MSATLLLGSCEPRLRELSDCSIDALVTDPPAGIGFMNREWDSDKGGRDQWIAWLAGVMRECLRVLRPGGYALVWALPRTSHWTATAIEDAGFEIRDVHHHIFGTGFPKSLDVAKAGAARWKGHGTALKPAVEHWILARKPLEGTYAENVLKHGTGALRIDECRIGVGELVPGGGNGKASNGGRYGSGDTHGTRPIVEPHTLGRWPAHLSLEHAKGCRIASERVVTGNVYQTSDRDNDLPGRDNDVAAPSKLRREYIGQRRETVPVYDCVEGCPVRTLDEQSGERTSGSRKAGVRKGIGYNSTEQGDGGPAIEASTGGASRFFYIAKPSRREKDAGLEDLPAVSGGEATGRTDGSAGTKSPRAGAGRTGGGRNTHPTVKAVALMRWLVRLITPPGGLVLDCFAGSGTTGVACAEEGLRFIGIEQDAKFHETARLRLRRAFGAVAVEMPAQRNLAAVLTAQPRVS